MPARCKLYQLHPDGQWEDKGTGHVQHAMANEGDGEVVVILTVMEEKETDAKVLLKHRLKGNIEYTRQGNTIITWSEPKPGPDLALSFQEESQCDEVWKQIISVSPSSTNKAL